MLKRLKAAFLRPFEKQHGEKWLNYGILGATGTLRKANSYFDPPQTGWGWHHHFEAAVEWCNDEMLIQVSEGKFSGDHLH